MMIKQIHIDLETLDTAETAQILSIGAVCGNDEFYREINTDLYRNYMSQFTTSSSTVAWWEDRGGFKPTGVLVAPEFAMRDFSVWYSQLIQDNHDDAKFEIWANSPSFDCDMIKHHLKVMRFPQLWQYHQERDVRTIKALALDVLHLPLQLPEKPHDALLDAKLQRTMVVQVLNHLIDLESRYRAEEYVIDEQPVETVNG